MDRLFVQYHEWLTRKYYESKNYNLNDPLEYGKAMAYEECMATMVDMLKEESQRQTKDLQKGNTK